MPIIGEVGRAVVSFEKMNLEWSISDFFALSDKVDDQYCSPVFNCAESLWYLRLFPNGQTKHSSSGWVGLYLVKGDSGPSIIQNPTLSIKEFDDDEEDESGEEKEDEDSDDDENTILFTGKGDERGHPKFWLRSKLQKQVSTLMPDKTLTIICHLTYSTPSCEGKVHLSTVKEEIPRPVCVDRCVQASPEIPRDTESLAADISTLLQDESFSDFQLKCRGRVFRVHRNVLAARSEVFRAMFRNPMREGESETADIEDLEVPVLESLISFVYSGTLEPVSEETVFKMYQVADKYAVHSLKSACSYWMTRNLTQENCVRFLDVAEAHCDRDLRAAVVSFILEHPGVMKTEAWLAFSKQRQELAIEIFQTYVSSTVQ